MIQLSMEEELILKSVKEFAENEVAAQKEEIDREEKYPTELMKRCGELGLLGINIPEAYGGLGMSCVMEQLVMEEIAKVCPVLALCMDAHMLVVRQILIYGNDAQKEQYIPKLASGEVIGCCSQTEAPGSANFTEWPDMGRFDENGDVILNATKVFATNAAGADLFMFMGKINGQMMNMLAERSFEGLSVAHQDHKMGMNGSGTATIRLVNVRVPKENLLIPGADYAKYASHQAVMYLNISSIALGIAEAALDKTIAYVRQRTRLGKPLGAYQAVEHMISQMKIKVETSRSIIHDAAAAHDAGQGDGLLDSVVKAYAPNACFEVVNTALQLHGGLGYIRDSGLPRMLEDIRVCTIGEAPTEMHLDTIAVYLGLPVEVMPRL